ncbi:MAG: hypothetical protein H0T76_05290 [Nannocystis sp.]|nr:hypothetical protein [Nannocystis sp.]MBA3545878.1 hypothetical protein [Nannocystis sp.]
MTLFITIIAVASLIPALFAAYGAVRARFQHKRLHRELVRAFHPTLAK